jgi:dTDP-4-dehydrorhamnose reductase
MLGTDVLAACQMRGHDAIPADRTRLDVTDLDACRNLLARVKPDAVLHCAARTDVDGAEKDPEGAYRGNALGAWHMAAACAATDTWLAYVSTDFVFDGEKGSAYDEFDPVNPVSVYGRSKEAGERLVRQTLPDRHLIARTSFLYGVHGKNIIKSIARFAQARPELTFVTDQVVSPTHTADVAHTLLTLIENPLPGTYHVASAGECSLFELAQAVVANLGLCTPVVPTTFAEFVEKYQPAARRPRHSPLLCRALALRGLSAPPPWHEALTAYLQMPGATD